MSARDDRTATVAWMRQGTGYFRTRLDTLTDADLRDPSRLPGWSRAHVIGHIARNAEALGRLAHWARTGIETPMYADREQRAADIARSAAQPAAVLRSEAVATAELLDQALDNLEETGWSATVRSAMGRQIPATDIPWLRVREVWLHAIDLDAGARFADLPPGLIDTLLTDVVAALSVKPDCPPVTLAPTDRENEWRLGSAAAEGVRILTGPAAELAGWVTGRIAGSAFGDGIPELPTWL